MKPNDNIITPAIKQMQALQAAGMDCSDASMVFHPVNAHSDQFILQVYDIQYSKEFWADEKRRAIAGDFYERAHGRDVPAYTAEDMLRKIPESIVIDNIEHRLFIGKTKVDDLMVFAASYSFVDENGRFVARRQETAWESTIFIQLLYKILVWCINNKHIKTQYNGSN